MKEDNKIKLYKLSAKILNISSKNINNKTSPENTPSWDSFNGLLIIDELEKAFGIEFSINEIIEMKNIGDIKRQLNKHGIKVDA